MPVSQFPPIQTVGIVTFPVQEMEKMTNDVTKTIIIVSVTFIGIFISPCGGLFGGFLYFSSSVEPTPEWQSLGQPSERIKALIATETYTVYAETEKGNIYSCYWVRPNYNDCWNEVKEVPELIPSYCNGQPSTPIAPNPPSAETVIDIHMTDLCANWAGRPSRSVFEYYLLDNGDVLRWGVDRVSLGPPPGTGEKLKLNLLVGLLVGTMSASIIGILGIAMLFYIHKSRPDSEDAN